MTHRKPFIAGMLAVLIVAALALSCPVSAAAPNPPAVDPQFSAAFNDPINQPLADTCSESVYNEEMNAKMAANQAKMSELMNNQHDGEILQQAKTITDSSLDLWWCPLKITSMLELTGSIASLAANIAGAIYKVLIGVLTNLVNTLLRGVCSAVMAAVQTALSLICIPNLNAVLKLPSFTFNNQVGVCNGTPLLNIIGGNSLPQPPLNYGAAIPATNFYGGINVLR